MCEYHDDCFALKNGECHILKKTNFKDDCPFYKHKDKVDLNKIEESIENYAARR